MQPHPLLSKVPGIRWAGRIFFILLAAIFLAMGGLLAAAFVIESRETAVLRSEGIRVAADIEGGVTMWQKKRRDGSEVSHKFEFTVAYTDKSGASHRKSITTSKDALKVSHGDGKMHIHSPDTVDIVYHPRDPGVFRLAEEDLHANGLVLTASLIMMGAGILLLAMVVRSLTGSRRSMAGGVNGQ